VFGHGVSFSLLDTFFGDVQHGLIGGFVRLGADQGVFVYKSRLRDEDVSVYMNIRCRRL
jgi:hypothetical protein